MVLRVSTVFLANRDNDLVRIKSILPSKASARRVGNVCKSETYQYSKLRKVLYLFLKVCKNEK